MKNEQFSSALYVVIVLARNKKIKMNSRKIAMGLKTNPVVVRRLVTQMAEAGILEARKGRDGGVWLSRDPQSITLADIYKAVCTRDLIVGFDRPKARFCPVSCSMKTIVKKISSRVEKDLFKSLSQFNIADFTKGLRV